MGLENQKADIVDAMGIDGKFTLYLAKIDGIRHWFKVPNEVALNLASDVECSLIMEFYDETGGVECS